MIGRLTVVQEKRISSERELEQKRAVAGKVEEYIRNGGTITQCPELVLNQNTQKAHANETRFSFE